MSELWSNNAYSRGPGLGNAPLMPYTGVRRVIDWRLSPEFVQAVDAVKDALQDEAIDVIEQMRRDVYMQQTARKAARYRRKGMTKRRTARLSRATRVADHAPRVWRGAPALWTWISTGNAREGTEELAETIGGEIAETLVKGIFTAVRLGEAAATVGAGVVVGIMNPSDSIPNPDKHYRQVLQEMKGTLLRLAKQHEYYRTVLFSARPEGIRYLESMITQTKRELHEQLKELEGLFAETGKRLSEMGEFRARAWAALSLPDHAIFE